MGFRRPVQLGVLLIALVVSVSMALAQEQGQQGPTKQPMGNGMSNEQMQMMHQQMVRAARPRTPPRPRCRAKMPSEDRRDCPHVGGGPQHGLVQGQP